MQKATNRAMRQEQVEDDIDLMREEMLEDWEEVVDPLLDPVQDAVQKASYYEEFVEQLPLLFDSMQTDEFIKQLAQGAFQARGAGNAR